MIKLTIINKNGYLYVLEDENKKQYNINIEFMGIEKKTNIGDIIYLKKELISPTYDGYSTNYTFGTLENKYGKENISLTDIDVIKLLTLEEEKYLKRIYG